MSFMKVLFGSGQPTEVSGTVVNPGRTYPCNQQEVFKKSLTPFLNGFYYTSEQKVSSPSSTSSQIPKTSFQFISNFTSPFISSSYSLYFFCITALLLDLYISSQIRKTLFQFISKFSHLHLTQLSGCLCTMEKGNLTLSHGVGSGNAEAEDPMELPPGFRFHPTDEELITHYLSNKILDARFDSRAIGEVDLNKCEPWDLPRRAKLGEKEWYFFCVRDRKYPTGLRTNRATDAGYWKATGKDKEINRGKLLVGMKKTLVFYRGRAPRGEKSDWVMHEFRLEGKNSICSLPRAAKNEWVICRVFKKSSVGNGKKAFGMANVCLSYEEERGIGPPPPALPPLKDIPSHVTCFSNAMECFTSPIQTALASNPSADMSSLFLSKFIPTSASLYGANYMNLLEAGEYFAAKQRNKLEMEMLSISQETGLTSDMNPESSSDNEIERSSFEHCLWNC